MRQPRALAIDLFAGLGGWAEGFLAEGYDVVGFDIERHVYGDQKYPAQLVLQDVLTLHGSQFRDAAVIVASPPCQAYSYRAMPWKRAKALPPPDNSLFEACFRIAEEAGVPIVVENVKGAQPWVGRARWHYGSFYLWGDVPALMPLTAGRKNDGGSWFAVANNTTSGHAQNPDGRKIPGQNWSRYTETGEVSPHWNMQSIDDGVKVGTGSNYERGRRPHLTNPDEQNTFGWSKDTPLRNNNSKSAARQAASAQIAKIPFPLAQHIARTFKPLEAR